MIVFMHFRAKVQHPVVIKFLN